MPYNSNGCVMMNVSVQGMPDLPPELGYIPLDSPEPEWWGIQVVKHITLKYGLVNDLVSKRVIDLYLDDPRLVYNKPTEVGPDCLKLKAFGNCREWKAVVLTVNNSWLHRANAQLSKLPHVDTYPVYKPHVNLGYVLTKDLQEAMDLCKPHLLNTRIRFGDYFTSELY